MKLFVTALLFISFSAIADVTEDVRCREMFIDADARFVGNSVSRGPAEVAEAWSAFFADNGPDIKWRPQFVEILEDGNLALSRGPYRMITRDAEGKATEFWGTFNSVWRRHADGIWKIVFDAGSTSADAPSEEVQALLDQVVDC